MSRWNKAASCVAVPELREFIAALRPDFHEAEGDISRSDLDKAFARLAEKARSHIMRDLVDEKAVRHLAILCDSATSGKLKIMCILARWISRTLDVRSVPLAFSVSEEMSIDADEQLKLLRAALEPVANFPLRLVSAVSDCGTEKTALRSLTEEMPEDSRVLQTSCLAHHLDLAFRQAFTPLSSKKALKKPSAEASERQQALYATKMKRREALLAEDAALAPLFELTAPVTGAMRKASFYCVILSLFVLHFRFPLLFFIVPTPIRLPPSSCMLLVSPRSRRRRSF
jgi:hypothetical protein